MFVMGCLLKLLEIYMIVMVMCYTKLSQLFTQKKGQVIALFTLSGALISNDGDWTLLAYFEKTHKSDARLGIGYIEVKWGMIVYGFWCQDFDASLDGGLQDLDSCFHLLKVVAIGANSSCEGTGNTCRYL